MIAALEPLASSISKLCWGADGVQKLSIEYFPPMLLGVFLSKIPAAKKNSVFVASTWPEGTFLISKRQLILNACRYICT